MPAGARAGRRPRCRRPAGRARRRSARPGPPASPPHRAAAADHAANARWWPRPRCAERQDHLLDVAGADPGEQRLNIEIVRPVRQARRGFRPAHDTAPDARRRAPRPKDRQRLPPRKPGSGRAPGRRRSSTGSRLSRLPHWPHGRTARAASVQRLRQRRHQPFWLLQHPQRRPARAARAESGSLASKPMSRSISGPPMTSRQRSAPAIRGSARLF